MIVLVLHVECATVTNLVVCVPPYGAANISCTQMTVIDIDNIDNPQHMSINMSDYSNKPGHYQ